MLLWHRQTAPLRMMMVRSRLMVIETTVTWDVRILYKVSTRRYHVAWRCGRLMSVLVTASLLFPIRCRICIWILTSLMESEGSITPWETWVLHVRIVSLLIVLPRQNSSSSTRMICLSYSQTTSSLPQPFRQSRFSLIIPLVTETTEKTDLRQSLRWMRVRNGALALSLITFMDVDIIAVRVLLTSTIQCGEAI